LLVILVPVLFAFMGFGLDLGRMYLVRGELNQAASAMALAAATQLIGTSASLDNAMAAAQQTLDNADGFANKYYFGSLQIGQGTATLNSTINAPAFFTTLSDATSGSFPQGDNADGTSARHVQISITGDSPLLFWSVLSVGQSRKTTIAAVSTAGISAPLCTACAIEPIAVAAVSTDDTTDFGFVQGTRYTLGYECQATPPFSSTPAALAGSTERLPFLILDHYDSGSFLDEGQQLYRIGAQGLLPSTFSAAPACITINDTESMWATASPGQCGASVNSDVVALECGLYSRFDITPPDACANVTSIDTLAASYQADTDVSDLDDYTAYVGTTRRVITIAIVDALSSTDTMTILGFRQFLVEPDQGTTTTNPADTNGRFVVMYIGSPVPLRQGRFDGGCLVTSGPGKVVLHQ
jgi:Flp pilus assembly protein TadG